MNFFEYVMLMKEQNTPVAIAGLAVLALFLLVIILKMLGGMHRGGWRQFVRTAMTAIAAVVSYIAAVFLSNSIIGSTNANVKAIEDLIGIVENYVPGIGDILRNLLHSFDPEIFESVILLPATIVLIPLLATIIFLLLNFILKLVRAIIIKIFRFKKAKNNAQRLGGAIFAAVEAIIWIIMITLPITGVISLAKQAYEGSVGSRRDGGSSEITEFYEEYIDPISENPAIAFIESLGSSAISDGIATIEIEGEKVNMREETLSITKTVIVEIPLLKDIDFTNLSEDNKVGISNLINGLCDSSYVTNLFVGTLQSASSILELDVFSSLTEESEFSDFFQNLIGYFESVSKETLHEDLATIKELYFTVSDSGVLKELVNGNTDIIGMLQAQHKEGDNTINKLISILQGNARTSAIVKSVTESLISSLATEVDLGNGVVVTVTYDTLKDSMNNVLSVKPDNYDNRDEYMDALSDSVNTTLTDNGIELEPEVVDSIAEFIDVNEINSADVLTDENFTDVLLHYYDAYLEHLGTGEEIPEDILDQLPDGIDGILQ